jgi:hypothetical protein
MSWSSRSRAGRRGRFEVDEVWVMERALDSAVLGGLRGSRRQDGA